MSRCPRKKCICISTIRDISKENGFGLRHICVGQIQVLPVISARFCMLNFWIQVAMWFKSESWKWKTVRLKEIYCLIVFLVQVSMRCVLSLATWWILVMLRLFLVCFLFSKNLSKKGIIQSLRLMNWVSDIVYLKGIGMRMRMLWRQKMERDEKQRDSMWVSIQKEEIWWEDCRVGWHLW